MSSYINQQVILKHLPKGIITEEIFELKNITCSDNLPEQYILGKTLWLSMDPTLFGRLRNDDNYAEKVKPGEIMHCYGIAQVIESKCKDFKIGDIFFGLIGMQSFTQIKASEVRKLNPFLYPITLNLSIFGISGLTAYFGLIEVLKIKRNETVVISAAVGSVGSLAGQIAKINGCRTIALVGNDDKICYAINELGYDVALNYKKEDFAIKLKAACPQGIDAFFDNIGGDIPNTLLPLYNTHARIAVCGRMALQHLDSEYEDIGIRDHTTIIRKRIRKQGFLITDYYKRFPEAILQLLSWYKKKKINIHENIIEGIDNTPKALLQLITGNNIGKQLVKINEPDLTKIKEGKIIAKFITSPLFPLHTTVSILRFLQKNH